MLFPTETLLAFTDFSVCKAATRLVGAYALPNKSAASSSRKDSKDLPSTDAASSRRFNTASLRQLINRTVPPLFLYTKNFSKNLITMMIGVGFEIGSRKGGVKLGRTTFVVFLAVIEAFPETFSCASSSSSFIML